MPKYVADVKTVVTEEEAVAIVSRLPTLEMRAVVSLLYFTGARPAEVLELHGSDFMYIQEEDALLVRLPTKKRKQKGEEGGRFELDYRHVLIRVHKESKVRPLFEYLLKWVSRLKPTQRFTNYAYRTLHHHVAKASEEIGIRRTLYSFRHSRLTMEALRTASIGFLKSLKGAKTTKSVEPYLEIVPVLLEF